MSAATSRKLGGVGRTGLGGAPREAEPIASPTGSIKPTSSRAHDPVTPTPPRPVQYTLRLSYDESDHLSTTARTLRRELDRAVDQSDVLRALVELAATDDTVRSRLTNKLTHP